MKSLYVVLCAAFISAVSLPMFGMDRHVAMDENEIARRRGEIAVVDACRAVGKLTCGIVCPLAAGCCSRDLMTTGCFALIGIASGEAAGCLLGAQHIRAQRTAEEHKKND